MVSASWRKRNGNLCHTLEELGGRTPENLNVLGKPEEKKMSDICDLPEETIKWRRGKVKAPYWYLLYSISAFLGLQVS